MEDDAGNDVAGPSGLQSALITTMAFSTRLLKLRSDSFLNDDACHNTVPHMQKYDSACACSFLAFIVNKEALIFLPGCMLSLHACT